MSLMKHLLKLKTDSRGATAIEYGLIASLVAVMLITSLGLLGTDLAATFNSLASKMTVAS